MRSFAEDQLFLVEGHPFRALSSWDKNLTCLVQIIEVVKRARHLLTWISETKIIHGKSTPVRVFIQVSDPGQKTRYIIAILIYLIRINESASVFLVLGVGPFLSFIM